MVQPDPPARMPQVRDEDFTDETRAFFGQWTGGIFRNADTNPVLRTFAHHPLLANAFSPLNIHLLGPNNTLPVKLRQIAIMRVAWITKATYMWSSHLNTSKSCGLTDEFYAPVQRGADDPYFTPFEATVIRAAEDLVRDQKISDANWAALSAQWSEAQMLDFMFTVGCYTMVAGVMRSTGAERQQDLLALAEKYGAPETVLHEIVNDRDADAPASVSPMIGSQQQSTTVGSGEEIPIDDSAVKFEPFGTHAYIVVKGAKCLYEPHAQSAVRVIPPYGSLVSVISDAGPWVLIGFYDKEAWTPREHLSFDLVPQRLAVDVGIVPPPNYDFKAQGPNAYEPQVEVGPRGGTFVRTASGFRRYF